MLRQSPTAPQVLANLGSAVDTSCGSPPYSLALRGIAKAQKPMEGKDLNAQQWPGGE